MERRTSGKWLRAPLAWALACMLHPAWAAGEAIFERAAADGSVELTNLPDDDSGYQRLEVPVPPPQSVAPAEPTSDASPRVAAAAESVKATHNSGASVAGAAAHSVSEGPMGATLKALYNGARTARQR